MTDKPKDNVVSLKAIQKEPTTKTLQPIPEIVEYLEQKLALAKEGKVVAMSTILLEHYEYDAPVVPTPALFVGTAEDLATIKMTYDVAIVPELNYLWAAYINYAGGDDE